jgi:SAM-dependent methyltransferase
MTAASSVNTWGKAPAAAEDEAVTRADLEAILRLKYGEPAAWGWSVRMSYEADYFTPDDYYEALVGKLVQQDAPWLDVGCGRDLFPHNQPLASLLSERSGHVVGVDPDDNLDSNPFVHARAKVPIEQFSSPFPFPLITLRMVAEHIADPGSALAALARLTSPGSKVVVYTVNRWSPVALAAWLIPFRLHHPLKRLVWGCEERDTFPVAYRLNTRDCLARAFAAAGFRERSFHYLEDCRTFALFRRLHRVELAARRLLNKVNLRYPENCLLGVYERVAAGEPAAGQ